MALQDLFHEAPHQRERAELPLIAGLCARYAVERPFQDLPVVFGHVLVRNSLVIAEALLAGGAELTFADAFPSPADGAVRSDLARHGVPVLPVERAVLAGDHYLDVSAVLGSARVPGAAAEATRTGVLRYQALACPVVSADHSRGKLIEGFFGTGDSFIRAWTLLRPSTRLAGKRTIQFGYGKIGRGVAWRSREAGMKVTVAEVDRRAADQASRDGFDVVNGAPNETLRRTLARTEIVISVTGIPGVIGQTLPPQWIRAASPTLVNLGALDEFGPPFEDQEILGGRAIPLNFHLPVPTWSRYIDPALAAHLLALEVIAAHPERYPPGVHPLPADMDEWIVQTWRTHWPEEDLTGIAAQLDLRQQGEPDHPV